MAAPVEEVFDEETNVRANFISREDLLAAKRAAGRRQDLADIEAIEKAGESQQPKPSTRQAPGWTRSGPKR